jgi:hypothetical protein
MDTTFQVPARLSTVTAGEPLPEGDVGVEDDPAHPPASDAAMQRPTNEQELKTRMLKRQLCNW